MHNKVNHLSHVAFVVALTVMLVSPAGADDEEEPRGPSTNLEVIQKLSAQVGDSLAKLVGKGDSVRVFVRPIESVWFVEGVILHSFTLHGCIPTQSLSAASEVDVGVVHARVEYANRWREGIFGREMVDRIVSIEIAGKVVNTESGAILVSKNFTESSRDTIEFSEIEKLENPGIPPTQGVLPPETLFSSLLEPLVMIGAVSVAVFLLFRVRS